MEENGAAFQLFGIRKFFLLAIFSCVIDIFSAEAVTEDSYLLCESKECLQHANNIIKHMKPTMDPCQDFYNFACGGYVDKFGKNETRTVYDDNWDSLQIQIKAVLETIKPKDGTVPNKLKTVYESCMDVGPFDLNSRLEALYFLKYFGLLNWPNLGEDFRFKDFYDTLGKLANYEEFAFITFKPTPYRSEDDSKSFPPALILPGNFLLNSKIKPNEVKDSVQRILEYFGINESEKEIMWNNFKAVEDIGIRLQNSEIQGSNRCDSASRHTYIEVNCSKEIQSDLEHLCKVWKAAVKFRNLKKDFSADIIHVSCRWYHLDYFEKIFFKLGEINDKSLADYLSIRFFLSHRDDLNFNSTKHTYPEDKKSFTKKTEPLKRWKYCVGWIIKSMHSALGYVYTKKVVIEPVQRFIKNAIKDYVEKLRENIEKLSWLDEKVKVYLHKQLKHLSIGFEKTMMYFKNETLISNEYIEYEPKERRFVNNVLELQRVFASKRDKIEFNSFYSSSDPYTMDFGFPLLFPPTFLYGLPKLWNYATLGYVVGHELSHNFQYFFDFVHLDEKTEKRLNSKTQCFVNQYSQFIKEKTGKGMNSRETEEEVVADNLGWALTERIIKEMDRREFFTLPGLNYTPLQLMYISFAQDACAVFSKQVEDDFYATKPQNLQNLRILGILQNSRMFSDTFNCSRESTMNLEPKCTFFD